LQTYQTTERRKQISAIFHFKYQEGTEKEFAASLLFNQHRMENVDVGLPGYNEA
jgi:hypothetical protein